MFEPPHVYSRLHFSHHPRTRFWREAAAVEKCKVHVLSDERWYCSRSGRILILPCRGSNPAAPAGYSAGCRVACNQREIRHFHLFCAPRPKRSSSFIFGHFPRVVSLPSSMLNCISVGCWAQIRLDASSASRRPDRSRWRQAISDGKETVGLAGENAGTEESMSEARTTTARGRELDQRSESIARSGVVRPAAYP